MSTTLTTTNSFLFTHEDVGGHQIRFRKSNSFGSLTDLCAIYKKSPANFLKLPSTKEFVYHLERDNSQVLQKVIATYSNGLQRGTWVHPLLLVEAARWCDLGFGIACNRVVLKVLADQGRVLANGDVVLPMNAQALEASLERPTNLLSVEQVEKIITAAIDKRIQVLHHQHNNLRNAFCREVVIGQERYQDLSQKFGQMSAHRTEDLLRDVRESAPLALPVDQAVSIPVPLTSDPNVYDASRPSLNRMRELIGERVRKYAKNRGLFYHGIAWNDLYAMFAERTGFDVSKRPNSIKSRKPKLSWVEDNGMLPALFDLSFEMVA